MSNCEKVIEHTEYGVMIDRTQDGLGYYLERTYREPQLAEDRVALTNAAGRYPAKVQVRTVRFSEWKDYP